MPYRCTSGRFARALLGATLLAHGSALFAATPAAAPADAVTVTDWKFHLGDDARWARPDFDDAGWESVDLTATADAHDSDVGLTRFVPGWQARGHKGYAGYAWYRAHVPRPAASGSPPALCGPFYVDSAYQLFVDGQLVGGAGDFATDPPVAKNPHLPRRFDLPEGSGRADAVLAVRVWMAPFLLADPSAGGIHIAPLLGTDAAVSACYRAEWREELRGYVVDAVEALVFLLLAAVVLAVSAQDRARPAYRWLAVALIVLAVARGNQAVLFLADFESIRAFELVTPVLAVPLALGAWTFTWRAWFSPENRWLPPAVIALLTLCAALCQFLRRSWFYGVLPAWVGSASLTTYRTVRWAFLAVTLCILLRAAVRGGPERWWALPAAVLVSVGLFTPELVTLHVRGIWFPFGTGVTLNEYAYALFDVALGVLLFCELSRRGAPSATRGGP
jgi:hypothetical protein